MALVAELEKIRSEIDANSAEAMNLCEGLSESQLEWRPSVDKWSIADNLIHLRTTTYVFLPNVDRTINEARDRNLVGEGAFGVGLMGKMYVWYVEPPPKIRLRAPRMLRPLLQGSARDCLPKFLESQKALSQRLDAANGLDLSRARFVSPPARFIRMNLLAIFSVYTGHQRRHLWQAANVRAQIMS